MTNYNIKQYSYTQAKKLGVSIFPSKKINKKIDIYKDGIYVCSIGEKGAMDYPSYIINDGKSMLMTVVVSTIYDIRKIIKLAVRDGMHLIYYGKF
jgi:hypothetical protein